MGHDQCFASREPSDGRPTTGDTAAGTVRKYLALFVMFYCLAIAFSLWFSLRRAGEEYENLALFTARSSFQQLVSTRSWNALHGGVYVPVTESTQPNPYLDDPLRDVVTTGGLKLTKLNPAFMTRLISEVMQKEHGAQLHMTSLRPINPVNAPDTWERAALESFEKDQKERSEVTGAGEAALFRYIAPLRTEASCLKCHAGQGYKLNDIRGGISVSFPHRSFDAALSRHRREAFLSHLALFVFGLGFMLVLGRLLLQRVRDLQESASRIRRLEGLLPICAGCKKIRTAGGDPRAQDSWEPFETYIHDRTDTEFTHGMCPECAKKYFGEFARS